jgi:hypothetical protein
LLNYTGPGSPMGRDVSPYSSGPSARKSYLSISRAMTICWIWLVPS